MQHAGWQDCMRLVRPAVTETPCSMDLASGPRSARRPGLVVNSRELFVDRNGVGWSKALGVLYNLPPGFTLLLPDSDEQEPSTFPESDCPLLTPGRPESEVFRNWLGLGMRMGLGTSGKG